MVRQPALLNTLEIGQKVFVKLEKIGGKNSRLYQSILNIWLSPPVSGRKLGSWKFLLELIPTSSRQNLLLSCGSYKCKSLLGGCKMQYQVRYSPGTRERYPQKGIKSKNKQANVYVISWADCLGKQSADKRTLSLRIWDFKMLWIKTLWFWSRKDTNVEQCREIKNGKSFGLNHWKSFSKKEDLAGSRRIQQDTSGVLKKRLLPELTEKLTEKLSAWKAFTESL